MVAPIRELVNIQTPTSASNTKPTQMAFIPANVAMDVNNDFIRGRSNSPSKASSRSTSVLSAASSIPYHERMEIKNDLPDEDIVDPIDSSQLLYKDNNDMGNSVGKVTDIGPMRTQCVQNEAPALKNTPTTRGGVTAPNIANTSQSDDVMNIRLPYDPN